MENVPGKAKYIFSLQQDSTTSHVIITSIFIDSLHCVCVVGLVLQFSLALSHHSFAEES